MKKERPFPYVLGLDLGTTSCGWAVYNLDSQRLEKLGVRLFQAAEHPKTGESLAKPRRESRGARRRISRRGARLAKIDRIFTEYGFVSSEDVARLKNPENSHNKPYVNLWELREKALKERLANYDIYRIIRYLCKHRGFQSNRRQEKKTDDGALLTGIKENSERLEQLSFETIGEMFAVDEHYKVQKRNKEGQYNLCVSRKELLHELKLIFERQRHFGNQQLSEPLEKEVIDCFSYQRPFATKELILRMIGKCSLERQTHLRRGARNSYSIEQFVLYSAINRLRLVEYGNSTMLTEEQRAVVAKLAFTKEKVTYTQIRSALKLSNTIRFNGLGYDSRKAQTKTEKQIENAIFIELKGYHKLRKQLQQSDVGKVYWNTLLENIEQYDELVLQLTVCKDELELRKEFVRLRVPLCVAELLVEVSFDKFAHISIEAARRILPYLKDGLDYVHACQEAGYAMQAICGERQLLLPLVPNDEIRNPVVYRAVNQARKVINAIINKYGSPTFVNIELGRDMNRSFAERRALTKEQDTYRKEREQALNKFKEMYKIEPTTKSQDLLKLRLAEQQQWRCVYSNKPIVIERLVEDGYVQIDHIIPYSRSFNDSLTNKVLVLAAENQNKRNQTPYEWLGQTERWAPFEAYIKGLHLPYAKKQLLLAKNCNEEEWKTRHLNDTRYLGKFLKNYVERQLIFAPNEAKQRVRTINGKMTAFLRKRWGLTKVREESQLHHALDAAVLAVTTPSYIHKLQNFSAHLDVMDYAERQDQHFPMPYPHFRAELLAMLSNRPEEKLRQLKEQRYDDSFLCDVQPVFVSKMQSKKTSGALHKETIYTAKHLDQKFTVKRKALRDLKKIDELQYVKETDPAVYQVLYERLEMHQFDFSKAFVEKVWKPVSKKKDTPPNEVKKVKVKERMDSGVYVQRGVAERSEMYRIDVFMKDFQFYICPVYMSDLKGELPNKIARIKYSEHEWPVLNDAYQFIFSLFKNDVVKVVMKNGQIIHGYYNGFDRSTVSIEVVAHDASETYRGIGVKNLKQFEKWQVDLLGGLQVIGREKRQLLR